MMRKIELLAPARTAEVGIEAIRHGADAVYIGGPAFSARAAAANSVDDIRRLCDFAHTFGAKVDVALNTILWDGELREAERTICELDAAGVDALIVQDMALLQLDIPPIALHSSTQCDTRTPEKVKFFEACGFSQVVLARELSLAQIAEIHRGTNVPLEGFIHGALCVSYSGQCYASQHCFGRSANRGNCAQFCRQRFDLLDADGQTLMRDKHLLSLRDMNRSEQLEALLDAGLSSLKIEGRLKPMGYVKNVTAYYRQLLDEILERRSADYVRASAGQTVLSFTPNLHKSFNRGFTSYYVDGERSEVHNFDTPKAMGERVAEVREVRRGGRSLRVETADEITLSAGDGLCFINRDGQLEGFRANKVEGNRIDLTAAVSMREGDVLFRNYDIAFEHILEKPSAERRLKLRFSLSQADEKIILSATAEGGPTETLALPVSPQLALQPQRENVERQLSKLGNTPFAFDGVTFSQTEQLFIPSSVLSSARRELTEKLAQRLCREHPRERRVPFEPKRARESASLEGAVLSHRYNVSNRLAAQFYSDLGAVEVAPSYEQNEVPAAPLMTCKYCLRYALRACRKSPGYKPLQGAAQPLYLRMGGAKLFRLEFDCAACEMKVFSAELRG